MTDAPEWITPRAPEPPRPTLASHRAVCVPCRAGLGACPEGEALEREGAEIVANAVARRARDAAIVRGERVSTPDPPFLARAVLRRSP